MRLLFLSNLFPPEVLGGYEIGCANVARSMRAYAAPMDATLVLNTDRCGCCCCCC